MTTEGVGETLGFADALSVPTARVRPIRFEKLPTLAARQLADFSRLLHALQYLGHVWPFSILPAALASFHSAPHFF